MGIINKDFVNRFISNNQKEVLQPNGNIVKLLDPVQYRWTHGATNHHLGDGMIIYSLIQMMRFKTIVCLGSGGGFIPRIMTQARLDLHEQGIFEGSNHVSFSDIGNTYLVDAANGVGGYPDYLKEDSYFRTKFKPRFIKDTTENAYYNFFVKEDIKIDLLHIDAGHSYEDVKKDFDLYSNLLSPKGIITIHDTDPNYENNYIVTEDLKETFDSWNGPVEFVKQIGPEWRTFNLFNEGLHPSKPSSTGLTLIQRNG